MKTKKTLIIIVALCVGVTILAGCSSKKKSPSEPRETWRFITVKAKVEAINHQSREVRLRSPQGNAINFTADESIKRLNEINVGDEVVTDYYVSLATELREPTAEEKQSPLIVLGAAAKMPSSIPPGVGGVAQVKAVVTIMAIDRSNKSVTIQGPLGRYLLVPVKDKARLKKVSVGDTVVVTYTEALAISVEKMK